MCLESKIGEKSPSEGTTQHFMTGKYRLVGIQQGQMDLSIYLSIYIHVHSV